MEPTYLRRSDGSRIPLSHRIRAAPSNLCDISWTVQKLDRISFENFRFQCCNGLSPSVASCHRSLSINLSFLCPLPPFLFPAAAVKTCFQNRKERNIYTVGRRGIHIAPNDDSEEIANSAMVVKFARNIAGKVSKKPKSRNSNSSSNFEEFSSSSLSQIGLRETPSFPPCVKKVLVH